MELSAKTIEMLDLPKVVVIDKGIEVISKPEVAEVVEEAEVVEVVEEVAVEEVPVIEAQDVVPVVAEVAEAPVVAEVAVVEDKPTEPTEPAEPAEPTRSIAIVSKPRSIQVISRSIKVIRKGDIDVKAEAKKIILAKKGKIV